MGVVYDPALDARLFDVVSPLCGAAVETSPALQKLKNGMPASVLKLSDGSVIQYKLPIAPDSGEANSGELTCARIGWRLRVSLYSRKGSVALRRRR